MPSAKRSAWWNTLICTLRNCAVELCPRGEVVSVYCAPVAARHPLRVILTWFSLRHHRESGGGGREVQRRAAPLPPPTQLLLPCVPSSFPSATTQTGPKTEPPQNPLLCPSPFFPLNPHASSLSPPLLWSVQYVAYGISWYSASGLGLPELGERERARGTRKGAKPQTGWIYIYI